MPPRLFHWSLAYLTCTPDYHLGVAMPQIHFVARLAVFAPAGRWSILLEPPDFTSGANQGKELFS